MLHPAGRNFDCDLRAEAAGFENPSYVSSPNYQCFNGLRLRRLISLSRPGRVQCPIRRTEFAKYTTWAAINGLVCASTRNANNDRGDCGEGAGNRRVESAFSQTH
jgi:hypothetical protein